MTATAATARNHRATATKNHGCKGGPQPCCNHLTRNHRNYVETIEKHRATIAQLSKKLPRNHRNCPLRGGEMVAPTAATPSRASQNTPAKHPPAFGSGCSGLITVCRVADRPPPSPPKCQADNVLARTPKHTERLTTLQTLRKGGFQLRIGQSALDIKISKRQPPSHPHFNPPWHVRGAQARENQYHPTSSQKRDQQSVSLLTNGAIPLDLTRLFEIAGPMSALWEAYGKIDRVCTRVSNHDFHTVEAVERARQARRNAKRWRNPWNASTQTNPGGYAGGVESAASRDMRPIHNLSRLRFPDPSLSFRVAVYRP
jgi:hypothetical protein